MSQAPVQKKSKNETNKTAAQQSGTAIFPFLSVSASMLFPRHVDCFLEMMDFLMNDIIC